MCCRPDMTSQELLVLLPWCSWEKSQIKCAKPHGASASAVTYWHRYGDTNIEYIQLGWCFCGWVFPNTMQEKRTTPELPKGAQRARILLALTVASAKTQLLVI